MKTDKELGQEVCDLLVEKKVETPLSRQGAAPRAPDIIENCFIDILLALGLDVADDSLHNTPKRIAHMYTEQIFKGLNYDNFPQCTVVENKMNYDEMLIVSGIKVSSVCEHHFVAIDGTAKIAYVPNEKLLGLSKFNRVVDFFSRRPQIQERLTEQIYHTLCLLLDTENIAIEILATHHCVKSRGVQDANSYTTTRKLGGVFKHGIVRNEFLNTK